MGKRKETVAISPDNINRVVSDQETEEYYVIFWYHPSYLLLKISLKRILSNRIPNLAHGDVVHTETCMYTTTPDQHLYW